MAVSCGVFASARLAVCHTADDSSIVIQIKRKMIQYVHLFVWTVALNFAIAEVGITVHFLCFDYVKAKYMEKIGT